MMNILGLMFRDSTDMHSLPWSIVRLAAAAMFTPDQLRAWSVDHLPPRAGRKTLFRLRWDCGAWLATVDLSLLAPPPPPPRLGKMSVNPGPILRNFSGCTISKVHVWCNALTLSKVTHTRTRTHTSNGPFSRTTRASRYQKGKPIWILLKQETVSGSGISWAVCKSAPRSRQFFTGRMPFLRPTNSVKALKAA